MENSGNPKFNDVRGDIAAAIGFGGKPRAPEIRITCRPFRNPAKTMLAFLTIELPSGLVLNDCKLMNGPKGRRWIALPAAKQLDPDGKPRIDDRGKPIWNQFVEFRDRATRERFEERVLSRLRRQHPELFEGEGAE
jgi:hypothetical protein